MVQVVLSNPIHAARVRIGPPSANQGPFTAKPNSCHVTALAGDPTYHTFAAHAHKNAQTPFHTLTKTLPQLAKEFDLEATIKQGSALHSNYLYPVHHSSDNHANIIHSLVSC